MVLTVAGIVMLVGLIIYLTANPANGRLVEVGRVMFFAGLLCVLLNVGEAINVLPVRGR